jgi:hypothetical protein
MSFVWGAYLICAVGLGAYAVSIAMRSRDVARANAAWSESSDGGWGRAESAGVVGTPDDEVTEGLTVVDRLEHAP